MGMKTIELSHLDKVLFPKDNITKGEVIAYYKIIAKRMLPYVKHRLVTMKRCPDGISQGCFYQQDAGDYFPTWITTKRVKTEQGKMVEHVVLNDADTLVYLANQACITPHVWLSRIDKLDYQRFLVFAAAGSLRLRMLCGV